MKLTDPRAAAPLVSLSNAGIVRGGRWLIRNVDLAVRRGEIVTLIGPNGAGKTTTAKTALGILAADEGTVDRTADLTIGYVPQKLDINWTLPLTVQRLMRLTGPVSRERAEIALARVGIGHLHNAEVQRLSGGEFQRALLARAIARRPDLLVLDEPVQGVDFADEVALYELIAEIRDDIQCGILLISHDLHVVMAETDHVVCLNGHVCCHGSPQAVALDPEYRRLFGDRTATTLAVYEHQHDHTHMPDGRVRHDDGSLTHHCHPADGHHLRQHAAGNDDEAEPQERPHGPATGGDNVR